MRTTVVLGLLLLAALGNVQAEPYLAVQQGMKCSNCHVNASGGGMRNEYGNMYAQMQLAASQLAASDVERWTGRMNRFVAFGGNLRADARHTDVPGSEDETLFDLDEARLYLQFNPLPGRVDIYLDQRVAPGGSINREAYGRYQTADGGWYVKAGRMYLPFGLRLEDDDAFIRSVPGINFTTPDTGVELGWETARWSAQLAISNGSGGGAENDNGKQFSARLEHVRRAWRLGSSININDTDTGMRSMQNVFVGVRTGPVVWLGELDWISDDSVNGGLEQRAALLEANWMFRPGQNLKLTTEYLDPDTALRDDTQFRNSVFWEYVPFEFTQLRVGLRQYDGRAQQSLENRTIAVLQWHAFF